MGKYILFCIFCLSIASTAQARRAHAVAMPKAFSSTASEKTLRTLYATELLTILGVDKAVNEQMKDIPFFLKNAVRKEEKNPQFAQKILEATQVKFERVRKKIPYEVRTQLIKEFTTRYTSEQLKYLVDINKYELYKNFRAFIESDSYYGVIGRPYAEATETLREVRRGIASEKKGK